MPSEIYSRLRDEDAGAIISYIRSLEPRGSVSPKRSLGPMARAGIAVGEFETAPAKIERARSMEPFWAGKEHEQGRYLASVACALCHDPDLGGREGDNPDLSVVGAYSEADFRRLMRTGVAAGNRQLREMSETARNHFSHFTEDELQQLHGYLTARAEKATSQ